MKGWTEADIVKRGLLFRADPLERARVAAPSAACKGPMQARREDGAAHALPPTPKPAKYGNKKTPGRGPVGEMRLYDSKKEARVAMEMNAEKSAGLILDWVPQPSFETGRDEANKAVRYRADALAILEVYPDGTFRGRLVDVKGVDTQASRAKRAALRARHLNVVVL